MMVHNAYLEYAIDLGLPGLVLFSSLIVGCVRSAGRAARLEAARPGGRELSVLANGIRVSLLAFAAAAFFSPVAYHFHFYYSEVWPSRPADRRSQRGPGARSPARTRGHEPGGSRDWSRCTCSSAAPALPLARPSLRQAALESGEGLRFRERAETWSLDQRREWMLARLREAAQRAWWTTPYYRGLFDEVGTDPRSHFSFDDFAALPPLERADVHRVGRALVSVAVPPTSFGRTQPADRRVSPPSCGSGRASGAGGESGIEYYMRRIGLPRGCALRRSGAIIWIRRPATGSATSSAPSSTTRAARVLPSFVAGAGRSSRDPRAVAAAIPPRLRERAGRWRTRSARAAGARAIPTRCFVTGAEKLAASDRARIESVFGRRCTSATAAATWA